MSPQTRHPASGFSEASLGCPRVPSRESFGRQCNAGSPMRPLAHLRAKCPCQVASRTKSATVSPGTHSVPGGHDTFHKTLDTCAMPHKTPRQDAESAATGCRLGIIQGRPVNLTPVAQSRKLFLGRPLTTRPDTSGHDPYLLVTGNAYPSASYLCPAN